MSEQTHATRRDLEAKLIARAWKDDAFRQELRRDPKAVLERELARQQPGARLPDSLTVQVLEETPTKLYLVLPPAPPRAQMGELSDAELERVAGGGVHSAADWHKSCWPCWEA